MDFQKLLNSTEYDFIRSNERLGDRIMLLGLGGSYAYGTNNEGSDIDFRGVTLAKWTAEVTHNHPERSRDSSMKRIYDCSSVTLK